MNVHIKSETGVRFCKVQARPYIGLRTIYSGRAYENSQNGRLILTTIATLDLTSRVDMRKTIFVKWLADENH